MSLYWKQRLYSYLLGKILGPYLEASSLKKLHESIAEVSIQDGVYELTDLRLNVQYLNELLIKSQSSTPVSIRDATLHRLQIQLSLQENNDDSSNYSKNGNTGKASSLSSLAWKAYQLGSTLATGADSSNAVDKNDEDRSSNANYTDQRGAVSLVVHVIIDGMTIELEPSSKRRQQQKQRPQQRPQNYDATCARTGTAVDESATVATSTSTKSIFSNYVDSIMNSLRLSVDIENLFIRWNSQPYFNKDNRPRKHQDDLLLQDDDMEEQSESWVQVRIYSVSYYDVGTNSSIKSSSTVSSNERYRTKLHKGLSLNDRITIVSGDRRRKQTKQPKEQQQQQQSILSWMMADTGIDQSGSVGNELIDDNISMIAEIGVYRDGTGSFNRASKVSAIMRRTYPNISLQVVEYPIQQRGSQETTSKRIQNNISIDLSQAVNVLIDSTSIRQIQTVVNAFAYNPGPTEVQYDDEDVKDVDGNTIICSTTTTKRDDTKSTKIVVDEKDNEQLESNLLNDWNDIQAMILKQYEDARALAENNIVVGGMLLPSINGYSNDGTPDITYDAFFDANDGGFSRCANDIQASIRMSSSIFLQQPVQPDTNRCEDMDWCHSKFRLHLKEGGFKILFAPKQQPATVSSPRNEIINRSDEYILLTFSDMNIDSSILTKSMEHSLLIGNLDVEDSTVKQLSSDPCDRMVEIGALVRFNPGQSSAASRPQNDKRFPIDGLHDSNEYEDDDDDGMLIVATPCISLRFSTRMMHPNDILQPNVIPIRESPVKTKSRTMTDNAIVHVSDIDLSLEPIELTYRQATISNVVQQIQEAKLRQDRYLNSSTYTTNFKTAESEEAFEKIDINECSTSMDRRIANFNFSCASLTIELVPQISEDCSSWTRMYDRCGYDFNINDSYLGLSKAMSPQMSSSSIGIHIDKFAIERKTDTSGLITENGALTSIRCFNAIVYTESISLQRRFDVVALCGRTEVDPYTPISIEVWQELPASFVSLDDPDDGGTDREIDENKGSRSVPHVLPISFFKARQADDAVEDEGTNMDDCDDDDDDEDHPEWVVSSHRPSIPEMHNENRRPCVNDDWRAARTDPQHRMKKEAAISKTVLSIAIPEVICDISTDELSVLIEMVASFQSPGEEIDEYHDVSEEELHCTDEDETDTIEENDVVKNDCTIRGTVITLTLDFGSFILHGNVPSTIGKIRTNVCTKVSYCFNMEHFQLHTFFVDSVTKFRHCRLLAHELNFIEVANLVRPLRSPLVQSVQDRLLLMNERRRSHAGSFVTPLLYRSHLFSPVSRAHPTILLDILNAIPLSEDYNGKQMPQMNLYFSAYDLTYRFNYDSLWVSRLQSLLPRRERKDGSVGCDQISAPSTNSISLTRVFLNCSDCNVDYSSSTRFATASRIIVRFGDVRVSSNVVHPTPSIQACKVSVGDVSLYLCNRRFPYNFENRKLLRAKLFMRPEDISLQPVGLSSDFELATVIRAMNYKTIMDIDAIDVNISLSNKKPDKALDPYTMLTVRIGEARMVTCKDSFDRFMATISEVAADASAVSDEALQAMKAKCVSPTMDDNKNTDEFYDPQEEPQLGGNSCTEYSNLYKVRDIRDNGCAVLDQASSQVDRSAFLLDGYDWTTIEMNESNSYSIPDGEEQAAKWYDDSPPPIVKQDCDFQHIGFSSGFDPISAIDSVATTQAGPRIIQYHFPLQPAADAIGDSDMGAKKYARTGSQPQVKARVVVHDFALKVRFLDGYDWPELLDAKLETGGKISPFVIPEVDAKKDSEGKVDEIKLQYRQAEERAVAKKNELMGALLKSGDNDVVTFSNIPLAEERSKKMKEDAELKRLSRNTNKYMQFSVSGVKLRLDLFEDVPEHLLASCLNLTAQDFMLVETISTGRPVRMAGEWLNEKEHPRDSREGLFMMKMVTWRPAIRVTSDDAIVNEESEATLKILPLRCVLDQRAIAFARAVFKKDEQDSTANQPSDLRVFPPPIFRTFRVRAFKLKVDYIPSKVDAKALRDGALVELVNLSPIDSMILTLQGVEVQNEVGFGAVLPIAVRRWVQDICSTQITKFLTNARPFEPITQVSGAAVDLIVLPWDAFKNGHSIQKALRTGTKSFSETLISEAFTVSSRVAQFIGGRISKMALGDHVIPNRPHGPPKGMIEATPHAVASISRGLQTANYKIMIIPYREYRRSGARGAVTSVIKGIPVAVAAPTSAAAEALSFTLLAARNQIRPDIRREEEAIQLKHH